MLVINCKDLIFSGKKDKKKLYRWHTGYPGGLKEVPAWRMEEKHGRKELLRKAVYGMLPKNNMRRAFQKRLLLFDEEKHNFESELEKNCVYESKLDKKWLEMDGTELYYRLKYGYESWDRIPELIKEKEDKEPDFVLEDMPWMDSWNTKIDD